MFTLTAPKLAALIAAAAIVGAVVPLPGGSAPGVATVHALAVPAGQLAGPCAGAPQLAPETLAMFFAPALDADAPSPVAIVDAETFTLTVADATYTVNIANGVDVMGGDAASAALLGRHVGLCVGEFAMTPEDAPGIWTATGEYQPIAAPVTFDN